MQHEPNGLDDTASAPKVQTCQCCGHDVPAGQEARHEIGSSSDDVYCLTCERVHVNGDLDAAVAAMEMLEATTKAALFGAHLNPEDAAAAVARVIARHAQELNPVESIAQLQHDIHVNNERMGLLGAM
jgi:hypothetical protein